MTVENEELGPAILAYPFAEEVAASLMTAVLALPEERWARSKVVGHDDAHESRTSANTKFGDDMRWQRMQVRAMLDTTLRHYNGRFHSGATSVESINLLRYRPGETYRPHVDSSWKSYRVVSAIIYLNPSAYDGGETSFDFLGVQVKPDRPSVVLFPSNYAYRHEARPVRSGRKYVVVAWMNDLPPDSRVEVAGAR